MHIGKQLRVIIVEPEKVEPPKRATPLPALIEGADIEDEWSRQRVGEDSSILTTQVRRSLPRL